MANDTAAQAPEVAPMDIAALIRAAVNEAMAPLQAKVDALQAGQPKIVRLPPSGPQRRQRSYVPSDELFVNGRTPKLRAGQNAQGTTRYLDTPEGRKNIPADYLPVFGPGDAVRINPDATVWGADITWGAVLASREMRDNPQGLGEVLGTMYLTETWEPKYKVQVRGMGAVGLRESELLFFDD